MTIDELKAKIKKINASILVLPWNIQDDFEEMKKLKDIFDSRNRQDTKVIWIGEHGFFLLGECPAVRSVDAKIKLRFGSCEQDD